MATWEDGPEYAPVERPASFADAGGPPLSIAPPAVQMAAYAPKERPAFDQPAAPVAALETLVPRPEETRDPAEPFTVVSAAMTNDSAWGALHSGPASPPPVSAPPPAADPLLPIGPPPPDGHFPAPGTPAWFGPGPYGEQPAEAGRVSPKTVWDAAMPGLCICLAVGGLVYVLAPILFAIAFGLSGRVKVARPQVRTAFAVGSAGLGLIAIIAVFTNDFGFGEWWATVGVWSLVACWALLVATLALVYRALRAGEQPEASYRSSW